MNQEMQTQGRLALRPMCELAGVSRASYYRSGQQQEPDAEEMAVRSAIQVFALAERHSGYRRIGQRMKRAGWKVNHKRVLRIMREDNLLCLRKKRFITTTDSDHHWRIYPNLAKRMQLSGINQLWVADITYVRLKREFIYVAIVLDVYSRRVVGFNIGRQLDSSLAQQALEAALEERQPGPGLIHHSDRGVQYASGSYVKRLERCGIEISMSRPGNPWDNAWAEGFMKTLKSEEVNGSVYSDFQEATSSIKSFIEERYNRQRLHSSLGYNSPSEFEAAIAPKCSMALGMVN
jgi:putative transposase